MFFSLKAKPLNKICEFILCCIVVIFLTELLHSGLYIAAYHINYWQVKQLHWPQFVIWVFLDLKMPNINGFLPFYQSAFLTWLIFPILLWVIYGRKIFYLWLTLVLIVYPFVFLMYLCFPTVDYLTNPNWDGDPSNNFGMNDLLCFPSFHCICSFLTPIAAIYGYTKLNGNQQVSFKRRMVQGYYLGITGIFSILIYFSTLFLKQHYIFDGIFSLIIIVIASLTVYGVCKYRNSYNLITDTLFAKLYSKIQFNKKQKTKQIVVCAASLILLGLALYYLIYICIFLWTDIWYAWYHQFPF